MIDHPTPLQRDIAHWLTAWTPEKLERTSPAIREAVALLRRVQEALAASERSRAQLRAALTKMHRYTITSEGASLGYFRLVEDAAGCWLQWPELEAILRTADAPPAPQVAASGSQGVPGTSGMMPLPDAAAIRERIAICERCQMRVPERLVTYGIGVRGGTSARCAACAPQPGAIGDANRQEVIEIRRARSAPATTEGAGD